ncbi:MAG: rRNA pseudouridine synthase [Sphingomonadales bacterium]|nr:rRNA pseudouridine synthase [Sphingomonadales bacterium]
MNKTVDNKGERIAKVLARAGVGSRREVERMIAAGQISINGKTLDTPATLVTSTEGIQVNGEDVAGVKGSKVWRFHKPKGVMTTNKDPEGRKTVFDLFPESLPRVLTVGRLDYNTEGLLLLTNDGGLSRWMELPKTGWKRQYRVRVHGKVKEEALKQLRKGVVIEGIKYGSIDAKLERTQATNAWLKVSIREGKNREIRKIMEHVGLKVNRLIRTAYGPFELGNLEEGEIDEVSDAGLLESVPHELVLKTQEPEQKSKQPLRPKHKPKQRPAKKSSKTFGKKPSQNHKKRKR